MQQRKQADEGNWQSRGQEFAVGQTVRLVNGGETDEGRVIAVWPAIGMVDIAWPHTSYRHAVETLQIINPGDDPYIAPMHENVPGGPGSEAYMSEGAPMGNVIDSEVPRVELTHEIGDTTKMSSKQMRERVAQAYINKQAYLQAGKES